jgi:hypothetical protein
MYDMRESGNMKTQEIYEVINVPLKATLFDYLWIEKTENAHFQALYL